MSTIRYQFASIAIEARDVICVYGKNSLLSVTRNVTERSSLAIEHLNS